MTSIATALADVLAAHREMIVAEVRAYETKYFNAAKADVENAIDEFTEAMAEHIKAELIRAVAAMAAPSNMEFKQT